MRQQRDGKVAYYNTAAEDGDLRALQCASGTMCYADLPPGYYDCWAPAGAADQHFRWTYLPVTAQTPTPTLAPNSLPAPTAAADAQATGVPAAGRGGGMAPGSASPIRLQVVEGFRLAILYSAAGPVTLYCTRVY